MRRKLPDGYVVSVGKTGYVPLNVNGVMCQRPKDAICQCVGVHMNDRLLQAAQNAFANGFIDKTELQNFEKEFADGR